MCWLRNIKQENTSFENIFSVSIRTYFTVKKEESDFRNECFGSWERRHGVNCGLSMISSVNNADNWDESNTGPGVMPGLGLVSAGDKCDHLTTWRQDNKPVVVVWCPLVQTLGSAVQCVVPAVTLDPRTTDKWCSRGNNDAGDLWSLVRADLGPSTAHVAASEVARHSGQPFYPPSDPRLTSADQCWL